MWKVCGIRSPNFFSGVKFRVTHTITARNSDRMLGQKPCTSAHYKPNKQTRHYADSDIWRC